MSPSSAPAPAPASGLRAPRHPATTLGGSCPACPPRVPAPGVLLQAMRWMLRKNSPLYVKPTADWRFARFMLTMLRY